MFARHRQRWNREPNATLSRRDPVLDLDSSADAEAARPLPDTPPDAMNLDPNLAGDEAPKQRGRGVYLLPNLLTTGTLFSGFYAIVAAIDGNYARSGLAVFIAIIFDGLDGRVARWTRTQSDFGKEYDSLSDMVAFGLAPAIVVYQWGVAKIAEFGKTWGRFGWLAAFFFAVAAALRLARFNARSATADKRYFEGLPSPSAAAAVAGFVWVADDYKIDGLAGLVMAFVLTLVIGALMVSRFSYWSGKDINLRGRIPWAYAAIVPLIYVVISVLSVSAAETMFSVFGLYAASAPLYWAWRKLRRRRRADAS